MIREEFQSGVGVGGAVSFALQKIAIKSTGVYLACFRFNFFHFLFFFAISARDLTMLHLKWAKKILANDVWKFEKLASQTKATTD